jgi:hypothetical protein
MRMRETMGMSDSGRELLPGEGRLYNLPKYDGQDDYLSDEALAAIDDRILALLPHDGFDMPSCRATTRTVTAAIAFDKPDGPEGNVARFEAMLHAATTIRTLHANLVAARQALARLRASDEPKGA